MEPVSNQAGVRPEYYHLQRHFDPKHCIYVKINWYKVANCGKPKVHYSLLFCQIQSEKAK